MNREELMAGVKRIVSQSGFEVYEDRHGRTLAFDILCKSDSSLIIMKVLANVDSLRPVVSRDLLILSNFLKASAVVIALRSTKGALNDGVVYTRQNLPLITPGTLHNLLVEEVPPLVFAAPGGYFVKLDSSALKEIRTKKEISVGRLAETAGVSRKAISRYEEGMDPSIDVAIRLEEALGEPIVLPINPFSQRPSPEIVIPGDVDVEKRTGEAIDLLTTLGYEVVPMARCPFNAFSRDRVSLFLTGISPGGKKGVAVGRQLNMISNFVERQGFIVVDRTELDNLGGTPVIRFAELEEMDCTKEVRELVIKRSEAEE